MSQKVLLLSPFIYPEPISTGKYNTHLARALTREGYSVEVIGFHQIYPEWKPQKTKAVLEGIKIYRGGGFLAYPKSTVPRRILLELSFMLHAARHILLKRKRDIVIPIFPPMLFFLFIRAFLPSTAKKIGIIHDIQGVMANLAKSFSRNTLIRGIQLFEKNIFNSCDKLIFLSKSMANRAINDYDLDPGKISTFYPFVTLKKIGNSNSLKHLFPSDYKHIVYSGAIGEKQNPYQLLKIFRGIVQKRADVLCHIFSSGPFFEDLKKPNPKGFGRIFFHDLVPEENLYELYLQSDIQIIPQKHGTSEGAIPSKLPNIISAGVPIFAISDPDSELSQIICKCGIGYCADSWDIDKLVVELSNFLEISQQQTHHARQYKVSDFVKQNFGIDQLVQAIIE
jgi:glycosyltransferase involved in cell wall biosynthesis